MLVRGFGSHVHLFGPLNDRVDSHRALLDEVTIDELRASPLPYRSKRAKPTDPIPYYGVSRRVTFRAPIDGEMVTVPGQVLVVLSESKLRLDRDHRQAELTRLGEGLTAITTKLNQRRHKSRDYVLQQIENARRGNKAKGLVDVELLGEDGQLLLRWSVNAEKLAQAEARDGKYPVGTTDLSLSAADILAKMKLRDGIERRIGVFKGPLKVRPIFVQTESRIRGLVFLTMVALLGFSLLELQLGRAHQPQTARSVIERFDSLQALYLVFRDGSMVRHAAEPSAFQTHLLAILGYPLPRTYLEPGC